MSVLFDIIYATKANGSHHKLALDALHHLENGAAHDWQRLFLKHVDVYLEGSKAPDKDFKDFRNHVLHVGDQFWGGAPAKARVWYDKLIRALKDKQFEEAVYCAGVLSHYYTDPIQPFHTAQSEAENNMHRAVEWSINKSYNMLRKKGLKDYAGLIVETGDGDDWIVEMVQRGATRSNQYYDALISNYNLDRGVVDPLSGLNENCHRFLSELVLYASLGFSRILDKAFLEAAVAPPKVNLSLDIFVASLTIPLRWVLRKLDNAEQRRAVEAAYDELQKTGKVEANLNEDDRMVRELYKKEVIDQRFIKKTDEHQKVKSVRRTKTASKTTRTSAKAVRKPRYYLQLVDEIEKAPSIGKKTAARLQKDGINTVAELLAADPLDLSTQLNTRWITEKTITDWQDQARLVCEVPGLRGGQAQILVAAKIRTSATLTQMKVSELQTLISLYCQSKEGQNMRACENIPDETKIKSWIEALNTPSRSLAA